MNTDENKLEFLEAKKVYDSGGTVIVIDARLPDHRFDLDSVPINKDKCDNKSFDAVMNEWYMFNTWSTRTPKPLFFNEDKKLA